MLIVKKVSLLLIVFTFCVLAGDAENTAKAFERRPGYVQPIVTSIGSMTNSGWYVSGELPKAFNYSVAIPISLIYLNKNDRQYSETYIDSGCQTCMEQKALNANIDCSNCIECQQFTAPTIFGTIHTPDVYRSIFDRHYNVIGNFQVKEFWDGAEAMNSMVLLPFATLQTSFSYYYSEIILRYIGIPSISGISVQFPGIGIRHDFRHFIPSCPVSLSLAANFTFLSATWEPGGNNMQGSFHFNGVSDFFGIIVGYKATKFLDVFLESGWEHATMTTSGEMYLVNEKEWLKPNLTVTGRKGFRIALNVSFPIKYNPVIGVIGGAQFGNLINILSYKSQNKDL
jgi:hypothetical protein